MSSHPDCLPPVLTWRLAAPLCDSDSLMCRRGAGQLGPGTGRGLGPVTFGDLPGGGAPHVAISGSAARRQGGNALTNLKSPCEMGPVPIHASPLVHIPAVDVVWQSPRSSEHISTSVHRNQSALVGSSLAAPPADRPPMMSHACSAGPTRGALGKLCGNDGLPPSNAVRAGLGYDLLSRQQRVWAPLLGAVHPK